MLDTLDIPFMLLPTQGGGAEVEGLGHVRYRAACARFFSSGDTRLLSFLTYIIQLRPYSSLTVGLLVHDR
jgi:hypothetical protein